jgi:2-keto-3-deoxy-6-phosphogluconate aldolase
LAVGGSWMVSPELIKIKEFGEVTRLTQEARDVVSGHKSPVADA